MSITIITIDFWQTLFDDSGGPARNAARKSIFRSALIEAGHARSDADIDEAFSYLWAYFDDNWLNHQRTPASSEMVGEICRRLEVELDKGVIEQVAGEFSRGILDHPPSLLPGVREAVEWLASRAKLALISDTAFSPGSVLRELMERSGIAQFFSTYVFSDETGVAKPHPEAFRQALAPLGGTPSMAFHIGDIERTDIQGAKAAGMKAVLYKGNPVQHKYAEEETIADAVMLHWHEIQDLFNRIDQSR